MRADHLSFKRAANFSLMGLALQLALGLGVLVYSVLAQDHAGKTASFYMLAGVIVWLVLAVVYDQHRRERVEAMEAESLAGLEARQTTVFEENAADLRVAAKRLAWMHKVLVPGSSLALAAVLVGIGLVRLSSGRAQLPQGVFPAPRDEFRPWEVALGLAVAVVGFLFARWVSGMAKQPVWSSLRAGATQAVGMALMGLAMAVGQFIDIAGPDTVLRYLQVAFPVAMVVLGAEIVLNFVLGIYRPRKPGEMPRPAFDSRILGFVAAPDKIAESIGEAINYQFGFEVTGSWFYQLLSRSIVSLVLVGVLLVWAMSLVAVVGPDERGLRLRNGSLVAEVGPGPYLKLPWPLERVETYKALQARRLDLASPAPSGDKPILWTNEHVQNEENCYLFCQPPAGGDGGESRGDAAAMKDLALVSVEVPVYYQISSVEKFEKNLGAEESREARLRAIGQEVLMRYMATVRLDDLLGSDRAKISTEIGRRIQAAFDRLDCGVTVLFAGVEGVHPPTTTAGTFEQVVASEQTKQANITSAMGDRIKTLTDAAGTVEVAEQFLDGNAQLKALRSRAQQAEHAGGTAEDRAALARQIAEKEQSLETLLLQGGGAAAAIIRQAEADRWATHMAQRTRAESYASQLASFRAAPAVYTADLYFKTIGQALKNCRVYIMPDELPLEIRLNNEDVESGGNPLAAPKPEDKP